MQEFSKKPVRSFRKFASDVKGSISTAAGMAFIPLALGFGIAVDVDRMITARDSMQDLADRAALYGAATHGTDQQLKSAADLFVKKGGELKDSGLTVKNNTWASATNKKVTVTINSTLQASITRLLPDGLLDGGKLPISVEAKAIYKVKPQQKICVLSLNLTVDSAVSVSGGGGGTGGLLATGCGVHVNSTAPDALHYNGSGIAQADFFHVVGGSANETAFQPDAEEGSSSKADPIALNANCGASSSIALNLPLTPAANPNPGSYGNVSIGPNKTATFNPGTYFIWGTVDLKGTIIAEGSTFVMCGPLAKIEMTAQSVLKLSAPTGLPRAGFPYPGFAVVGNNTATGIHTVHGGNNTYIKGIWYTPKGSFGLWGNAEFNTNSEYFPIIASTVATHGTARLNIKSNNDAYGYAEQTGLRTEAEFDVVLVYD